jgi:hypothetical protein
MVCCRYTIVNTVHTGDNKDNNTNMENALYCGLTCHERNHIKVDDGQRMRHVWGRNMCVKLKENDYLEDLGVVGRISEWTLVE